MLKSSSLLLTVGGQDVDSHARAVRREQPHFPGVVAVDAHQRGHVFVWIVALQEGGLAGQDRVVGGVRLVEAVAREKLDVVKDRVGAGGIDAVLRAALDEDFAVFLKRLLFLFGDGAPHQVRFAEFVAE